jgi:hypothetical protein
MLYRPDYSIEVRYLRAFTTSELKDEIQRRQVRRMYAFGDVYRSHRTILDEAVRQGWLRRIDRGVYEAE